MQRPSKRTSKFAALIVSPLAIVAAGALIFQASYAAFSSTTRNSGNAWTTGSLTLTNDSNGVARFQVANMVPGETDTKCITVTANATTPGVVKGYALNPIMSTDGLENHVMVSATEGTGGGFGSCNGYVSTSTVIPDMSLAQIMTTNSFADGFGGWSVLGNVPGGESRTYQITWTFDTTGLTQNELNQLQGNTTGLDFQWELQSS